MNAATQRASVLVLVLLAVSIVGCDSGGDDDTEELSRQTIEQLGDMMERVSAALGRVGGGFAFEAAATDPVAPVPAARAADEETVSCPGGGTITVDGTSSETETGTRFDYSTTFNDCDGIDGSLRYTGDFEVTMTETSFTSRYVYGMDGTLTEACRLTYDGYGFEMTTSVSDASAGDGEYEMTFLGGINGACGDQSFSCSFDGLTLSGSSFDEPAVPDDDWFADRCR